MEMKKSLLNALTYEVIGPAIEVHKSMGSGFLESVYQDCMDIELRIRGINYTSEMTMNINYKNESVAEKMRYDFFIENCLVLEIKGVEKLLPKNEAQLLTYMNLLQAPKGILINFTSVNIFKEGQKTFVNKFFEKLND